jgi:hypothetical protein
MAKKKVVRKSASKSRRAKSSKKPRASKAKSLSRASKALTRKPAKQAPRAIRPANRSSNNVQARSANLSREFYQGKVELEDGDPIEPRGIGSQSAGQSGDLQGLSEVEDTESESVEELVEEGQDFEAEIVAGVERAGDAPDAGVPMRQRKTEFDPEDSVSATPSRKRRGSR